MLAPPVLCDVSPGAKPNSIVLLRVLQELDQSDRCCHTNLIPVARGLEGPLRLTPQWRLATSGMLLLGGRGACGGR
jgi:hypothetical protein